MQIQSVSPSSEVVNAIKDRMVAVQREEQAAEASQQRTLADSQFYSAQKKAEGDAYQTMRLAEAQAEALPIILQVLEEKGPVGQEYIQGLIAQELRQNSKWIISDGQTLPVIDFGGTATETASTEPAP